MNRTTIYILRLVEKNWYIGRSKNIEKRFTQHLKGEGSEWTKKYPPIKIFESIPNSDPFDEDKYVKIYMNKYGIDKVRGGTYCQLELTKSQIYHLRNEIRMANDLCMRCGRNNHFVKNCYAKTDIDGNPLNNYDLICRYCRDKFDNIKLLKEHEEECLEKPINAFEGDVDRILNSLFCCHFGRK